MSEHPARRTARIPIRAAGLVLVCCIASACGSASGVSAGPTSAPAAASPLLAAGRAGKFNASGVGDLPSLPGSVSAGPAAHTATTEAKTFFLHDTTPRAAVVAYGALLHGWEQLRVPHPEGTTDFAATWKQGDHQLEVSAAPALQAAGGGSHPTTVQYSLLLTKQ